MKADEIYERMTARVIEALESGIASGTWSPPWKASSGMPHNATTGKAYNGGNVLALWITELDNDYPSSQWATYKQWEGIGAQVKKGEKGTHLIKWLEPSGKRDREARGEDAKKPRLVPVGFAVFNAAQVDGYDPPAVDDGPSPVEHAEAFFAATGSVVRLHNEGSAYYTPAGDYIVIPPIADFHSVEGFYATLSHEHVHWTGAKNRLDREGITTSGTDKTREQYAYEELIAELGATFIGATLGIATELREDHVQYLASWLGALKNDHKLIYKAAGAASRAANYLAAFSAVEDAEEVKVESAAA